jgi:hypothetical protein
MEDEVVTFEGSLDRMEATDVEVNPGAAVPYWSGRNSVKKRSKPTTSGH